MCQSPIGSWRTQQSFNRLHRLTRGGSSIYAASKSAVMLYDTTSQTTATLSRVDGLTEAGVATIGYDEAGDCLVIAYSSSNVDLIKDDSIYNLSDIRRADIDGSKSIHNIRFHNGKVYLCCDFGIVVVNEQRHEVETTVYLGSGGDRSVVYDLAFVGQDMVAATSRGMMTLRADDPYIHIASRWHCDSTLVLRGETPVMMATFADSVYVVCQTFQPDTMRLYRYASNGDYRLVDSGDIKSLRCDDGVLLVVKWDQVDSYHGTTSTRRSYRGESTWSGMANHDAMLDSRGMLWVAHDCYGLLCFDLANPGTVYAYKPDSPSTADNVYRLSADRRRVLLSPGGKSGTYESAYLPASVCYLENDRWQTVGGAAMDTLTDIIEAVTSPVDPKRIVAVSWGKGVVDIRDGQVVAVYNESNTNGKLQPYVSGSYRSLRTGGVAFDRYGNLWITNSLNRYGLVEQTREGTWNAFDTYGMVGGSELDHVVYDSVRGYIWFYGRANAIYVHDGQSRMAYVDPNNGSRKTTASVSCVVQDRNGDMWIGTGGGIKVIYDGYRAFSAGGNGEKSPVTCSNIVIDNGEFVEYLMAYESITCIAVDGANRKWVGTATGGLYLISANGQQELQHFTVQNSPLPSNKILTLAVHPVSGELFVGTDYGVVSYRSTATYAGSTPSSDIHAYPNPVEPDYEGPIAIRGFTRDALVHITDAAGHVVYSTRALGGQAIWYGRTNSGERVASGVYYVFASDEEKGNRSVTKILVVR